MSNYMFQELECVFNIFQIEMLIKSGPFLWRIHFKNCQRFNDKMFGKVKQKQNIV